MEADRCLVPIDVPVEEFVEIKLFYCCFEFFLFFYVVIVVVGFGGKRVCVQPASRRANEKKNTR